jgi:hypothetical protein
VRAGGTFHSKGVLVLALSVAGALDACGDSSSEKLRAAELAESCTLDTDCGKDLVCVFERCHYECGGDRDCDHGARCVRRQAGGGFCQLITEATCMRDKDCLGDQICGSDKQCRDECTENPVCLSGAICAVGGVCANEAEVDAQGNLIPKGTGGTSGTSGGTSGTSGGTSGTSGGTSGAGEGGVGGARETGGRASEGGTVGEGGSGEGGAGTAEGGTDTAGTKATGGATASGGANTSGGTGAGGTSGAVSTGGTNGGTSSIDVDEMEPNETDGMPMPLGLATSVHANFTTSTDADFYRVVAPASDLAGGYFNFSVTNIPEGEFSLTVLSEVNKGVLTAINTPTVGQFYFGYWAAAPGQAFLVKLNAKAGRTYPYSYLLSVKYTPVVDRFEPNDTRQTAADLALGEPVQGRLFTGYISNALTNDEYNDWYRVELTAGPLTAALTNVPASANASVSLYNSGGSRIGTPSVDGTLGADVTLRSTIVTPGIYYLLVSVYDRPSAVGEATTPGKVPAHFSEDYTFTVTQ